MYTIFQQPPFSKSGGNGSSHQNVGRPNSIRIGYLDALARLTGNTYAADFVHNAMFPEGLILNNQIPKLKDAVKHTIKRIQLAGFSACGGPPRATATLPPQCVPAQ